MQPELVLKQPLLKLSMVLNPAPRAHQGTLLEVSGQFTLPQRRELLRQMQYAPSRLTDFDASQKISNEKFLPVTY